MTQHEHSQRQKDLGFLTAEYCLKQVSGTGEQREGTGEQTSKGCSTLEKHLHELWDPKAINAFAQLLTDPESTNICCVPLT